MSYSEINPYRKLEAAEQKYSPPGLWVSQNVASARRFTLPASEWSMVPVQIERRHVMPIADGPVGSLTDFRISMRSRFAQAGLHPDTIPFVNTFPKRAWRKIRDGEPAVVKVPIFNWGARPVMIESGQEVFRLYNEQHAIPLQGLSLIKAVQNDMKISGYPKWAFRQGEPNTPENLVGLWLPISYEKASYIPEARRAIRLSNGGSARELIKRYTAPLEDFEGNKSFAFHHAYTPHVQIHGDKHALISPLLRHNHPFYTKRPGAKSLHIESRVIDGKNPETGEIKTDFEIILEIVGPVDPPEVRPTHVLMYVYNQLHLR